MTSSVGSGWPMVTLEVMSSAPMCHQVEYGWAVGKDHHHVNAAAQLTVEVVHNNQRGRNGRGPHKLQHMDRALRER